MDSSKKKHACEVCGREISREEYEEYAGMCWECRDHQKIEESDFLLGDL
jgi:RNA polymerase-binding transcription factor DksA